MSAQRSAEAAWFDDVTSDSGINFVHVSGDSPDKPFPAANGSGLGMLDYDLDGWQDLLFLTGTSIPVEVNRQEPRNRIFRNRGALQFEDVTSESGLGHAGYSGWAGRWRLQQRWISRRVCDELRHQSAVSQSWRRHVRGSRGRGGCGSQSVGHQCCVSGLR